MDISYLLRILSRRKWLIFSVMLAAAAAMYLFVGKKPAMYRASVILSTGIVNYKGIYSDNSDGFVQQYQVENAFSNLTEFVQSRSTIKLLTIRMLKHDLVAESGSALKPFRQANLKLSNFSDDDAKLLLGQISKLDLDSIADPAFSQQFDYLLDKVARAYGYDHDAIHRAIEVKRKGDTDYLTVEVVTENAQLSQYMADNYVSNLMTYYQNLRQRENRNKVDFYTTLTREKQVEIDSVEERIYLYRRQKGLATFNKQAEDLVNQISTLRLSRQRAEAKRDASKTSVTRLDAYIDDKQSLYSDETRDRVVDKYNILDLKEKVDRLKQERLKKGGKDPKIEKDLADATTQYEVALRETSRNVARSKDKNREEGIKDDLYKTKVETDLQGIDATQSVTELNRQIGTAEARLREFVGDDQTISNMEVEKTRADEEFTKLNEKLNEARLAYQTNTNPLKIIENAQFPEWPEPDRQVLLSVFAGIVVGTLTTIFIFLLAYMDASIQSPQMFRRYTNELPLLGSVNTVKLKNLDLKQVFSTNGEMPQYKEFRENLRRLRGEILASTGKVYLFVSTKPGEGKSFTMNALAHSLSANQKKVLLLDTNFKNPTLSRFAEEPSPNSALLNRALREHHLTDVFQIKNNSAGFSLQNVDVLGNTGRHQSPLEMMNPVNFRQFLADVGESYDYIFMEAAALNMYSDARELAAFADKVLAVFNAGSVIKQLDLDSIGFLQGMNGKFGGAVLTEVDLKNMA